MTGALIYSSGWQFWWHRKTSTVLHSDASTAQVYAGQPFPFINPTQTIWLGCGHLTGL